MRMAARSRSGSKRNGTVSDAGSLTSAPWMALKTSAQSSALRHIGPVLSMLHDSHHPAVAADAAEGGPQRGQPAAPRRRHDRPLRLGADRERDARRRGGRSGARRRPARPLVEVPRVQGSAAVPLVAPGELTRGELGREHRARFAQPHDHLRIVPRELVAELGGPPRRARPRRRRTGP